MSEHELSMLAELAEREDLTASEWVRWTVRNAHREAFGSKLKPSKPKRK